jgi:hypothetical protein
MPFRNIAFLSTLNPGLQQTSGGDKSGLLEKISQNPLLLMLALKDDDLNVKVHAASTLEKLGHADERVILTLNRALEDKNNIVNKEADTPNAVRTFIKAFMRENAADSIYYALPFFNIRRLKLPLALELVQELANPLTDERTKLVIFQLLMRVELLDEQGQPLRQGKQDHVP